MPQSPHENPKEPNRTCGRAWRVRRSAEFRLIYGQRCAASTGSIVVHVRRNKLAIARLGLTVSRKVGCAVVRNHWKRRMREAFRLGRDSLPKGIDYVVTVRGSGDPPALAWFSENLLHTAIRAAKRLENPRSHRGGSGRRHRGKEKQTKKK